MLLLDTERQGRIAVPPEAMVCIMCDMEKDFQIFSLYMSAKTSNETVAQYEQHEQYEHVVFRKSHKDCQKIKSMGLYILSSKVSSAPDLSLLDTPQGLKEKKVFGPFSGAQIVHSFYTGQ